jgi:hypothetical protein
VERLLVGGVHEEQWLVKIDMFPDLLDPGNADREIDYIAGFLSPGAGQD